MKSSLAVLLKLSYSPLCFSHYERIREDPEFKEALKNSSFYLMTKRRLPVFKNLELSNDLRFSGEIFLDDDYIGGFNLGLEQAKLGSSLIGAPELECELVEPESDRILSLKIQGGSENEHQGSIWLTPEKLILLKNRNLLDVETTSSFKELFEYEVLYGGIATGQPIQERTTGHKAAQSILSKEQPNTRMNQINEEASIMFFDVEFTKIDQFYESCSSLEKEAELFAEAIVDPSYPNNSTIVKDLEKALVSTLKPSYNFILYKNYPKGNDGLYNMGLSRYGYSFLDQLKFSVGKVEIIGGTSPLGGDCIIVTDNEGVILLKSQ